jgi:hypothetical protein
MRDSGLEYLETDPLMDPLRIEPQCRWFDSAPGHDPSQNLAVIAGSVYAAMFPFGFHRVSAAPIRTRS